MCSFVMVKTTIDNTGNLANNMPSRYPFTIQGWLVGNSWKYCINYLHHKDDTYCFSAKYSEPTRRNPVPRTTASVYFHINTHRKVQKLPRERGAQAHRWLNETLYCFHLVWDNVSTIPTCVAASPVGMH